MTLGVMSVRKAGMGFTMSWFPSETSKHCKHDAASQKNKCNSIRGSGLVSSAGRPLLSSCTLQLCFECLGKPFIFPHSNDTGKR